ncbi:patatin-like phospholipase family protein [Anaerosalibacter bizertensis]|uniref:patatin-like phospholipase family protein n=1 Tax=Anaerosalibacter bizertensis TaxID=932217 RepID=UPI001C0EF3C8|nr:patatin-like phospholipase family protein [Anaerosalibacter bizertensis]MBU5293334.1 patatin-like phospholipase family protein [Anaerosalibacter bizertensis]
MTEKPKIGIALGSGSARGFAHIGVLKALEENNIFVDIVTGSSAGALVGGLYCSGIKPEMIKNLAIQIDKKLWMDFTVSRRGILKGDKIEEILKLITGERNIEDLNKELGIVATDLQKGEGVIFTEGPLYSAIRSSISIPGVFEPVNYDNKVLVDGGVVDRVPISLTKDLGADIVIAVDVGFSEYGNRIFHLLDIIQQSIDIMAKKILEADKIYADILIEPPLSHIESSQFELVEECVEIGYKTALEHMDEIKGKIKLWEDKNSRIKN